MWMSRSTGALHCWIHKTYVNWNHPAGMRISIIPAQMWYIRRMSLIWQEDELRLPMGVKLKSKYLDALLTTFDRNCVFYNKNQFQPTHSSKRQFPQHNIVYLFIYLLEIKRLSAVIFLVASTAAHFRITNARGVRICASVRVRVTGFVQLAQIDSDNDFAFSVSLTWINK